MSHLSSPSAGTDDYVNLLLFYVNRQFIIQAQVVAAGQQFTGKVVSVVHIIFIIIVLFLLGHRAIEYYNLLICVAVVLLYIILSIIKISITTGTQYLSSILNNYSSYLILL